MRVALLSHNAQTGDAVGNQVAAKAAFFRDRGADVRVYLESTRRLHPTLEPHLRPADDLDRVTAELRDADLLSVEYSQSYRLLDVLPRLAGGKRPRVLLDYRGVTPPELWDGPRDALRDSQRRRGLVWFADEVTVQSQFARRELTAATGFPDERIFELPLVLETDAGRDTPPIRPAGKTLLFVGRLAANKRVPVLIEAVARLTDVSAVIVGDITDRYQPEFERCRKLAAELGVADRVRFLGHVSRAELGEAYRSADVFVMPSRHEGCCAPVLEALAHGLPVIAARAAALPETLGGAGLTFEPDDAADLARQIRRVLQPETVAAPQQRRVAIVAPQFGEDVLGGAERSLRLVATTLADAGYGVEVFTTVRPAQAANILKAAPGASGASGVSGTDGAQTAYSARCTRSVRGSEIQIHRFETNHIDERTLAAATHALRLGNAAAATVRDFIDQTRHSQRLIDAVASRQHEFDAVIVGPYANGLACEVAKRCGSRCLLLPCFHDEPLARSPELRSAFAQVGGFLYHSREERRFAEIELGLSHPNAAVIGTCLAHVAGDTDRGRRLAGAERYLIYCGRYCREKNLPELLDWWQKYESEQPGQFSLVCTGRGNTAFPSGVIDLGFVPEQDKADLIAGAAALVQPSMNESLSLAALEAWQAGVPVIGRVGCSAVEGHLRRCSGGRSVGSYKQFRDALDDLWQNPDAWKQFGAKGRDYVTGEYSSADAFRESVEAVPANLHVPLAELMRRRGLERAATFTPEAWTERFAERVDSVLHRDPVEQVYRVEVAPLGGERGFRLSPGRAKLKLELQNTGSIPLLNDGSCETRVWARIFGSDGEPLGPATATRLPGIVVPGQALRLPVGVTAPPGEGDYLLGFFVGPVSTPTSRREVELPHTFPLRVTAGGSRAADASSDAVQATLAEADALAELPAGYTDVSEGLFAELKSKLKRKLLHQFQESYVDALSRQQTAFNQTLLAAVQELGECTAMLEQTILGEPPQPATADLGAAVKRLGRRVRAAVGRIGELERRLERLERRAEDAPAATPEGSA